MKGFISFAVAAVFLFALLPAAALVSSQQPDLSFESNRAILVQEVAIKQAFYESSKQAARDKYDSMLALRMKYDASTNFAERTALEQRIQGEIEAALALNLQAIRNSFGSESYEVVFWCNRAEESARKEASKEMFLSGQAKSPLNANPLSVPQCALKQFNVNLKEGKIHFNDLGFSIYDRNSKIGKAAIIPDSYEVDFT